MVKNNIEIDVKTKCIEKGETRVNLAEEIETTKAYVNRLIKKQDVVVNQTYVRMMEALGMILNCSTWRGNRRSNGLNQFYIRRGSNGGNSSKCD